MWSSFPLGFIVEMKVNTPPHPQFCITKPPPHRNSSKWGGGVRGGRDRPKITNFNACLPKRRVQPPPPGLGGQRGGPEGGREVQAADVAKKPVRSWADGREGQSAVGATPMV